MARMSKEEREEGLAARLKRAEKRLAREDHEDFATREMDTQPDLSSPDAEEEPPDPVQESRDYVDPPLDGDEEEWSVPFPPETDEEQAATAQTALLFRDVTDEDLDRLWDWVRADEDKGLKFVGVVPATSSELRDRIAGYTEMVSVEEHGEHIGFGAAGPITPVYVMVHLYLSTAVRGQLRRLAPSFIAFCQERYPGTKLTVAASELAEVRLYQSFGFTVKHVLTLDPPAAPV